MFAITGILGIANAPDAEASTSTSYLEGIYAGHGHLPFYWSEARPWTTVIVDQQFTNQQPVYEVWNKDRVRTDPDGIWVEGGTILPNNYGFSSENRGYGRGDSVKMWQAMVNRWRELGYGSGSYLTLDGDFGSDSSSRTKTFQTWWFGSGDNVTGKVNGATWDALSKWLGYQMS